MRKELKRIAYISLVVFGISMIVFGSFFMIQKDPESVKVRASEIRASVVTNKTSMNIDLKKTKLNIIKKYKYLKMLIINNSSLLNKNDYKTLNNSRLDTIVLNYNSTDILNSDFNLDLSKINKKVVINFTDDELANIYMLNTIKNYTINNFADKKEYKRLKSIDKKINKLNKEINLDNTSDTTKVESIAEYICNKLDYDNNINYEEMDSNSTKKINYYNAYSLTSTILNNSITGICINYAYLFDILCKKNNINTNIVFIENEDINVGHVVNLVNLDGKDMYVDLTRYDNNEELYYDIKA